MNDALLRQVGISDRIFGRIRGLVVVICAQTPA
jgi:hypothetical protein